MADKSPFYKTIPQQIKRDESLSDEAKVIYGAILPLTFNDKGYCFANNDYFVNATGYPCFTVEKSINELSENHYISIKNLTENNDGYKKEWRSITLGPNNFLKKSVLKQLPPCSSGRAIYQMLKIMELIATTEKHYSKNHLNNTQDSINQFENHVLSGVGNE